MGDKCKQLGEIGLAKPASYSKITVSKVVAQNIGEAAFSYHQDPLTCSQTKFSWSYIDLSLGGPTQATSYPILVDSSSKRPEIIPIKPTTTGTVINNKNLAMSSTSFQLNLRTFVMVSKSPILTTSLISMVWMSSLLTM